MWQGLSETWMCAALVVLVSPCPPIGTAGMQYCWGGLVLLVFEDCGLWRGCRTQGVDWAAGAVEVPLWQPSRPPVADGLLQGGETRLSWKL